MRHVDLCIIGSGSGNSIVNDDFAGLSVALIDKGTFGGTCLNVGCIPTKMFVLPADTAAAPAEGERLGVRLSFQGADWVGIRDRIFSRVDAISTGGREYRAGADNVTLFTEEARFVAPRTVRVGEETITADRFVLAAGSRAVLPDIPGLPTPDVPRPEIVTSRRARGVHTSDTVMRIDELPATMIILGGGYVAAEFAHVFSAFGVQVTLVNRSGALLRNEDDDISQRFTEELGRRVDLRLNQMPQEYQPLPDGRVRLVLPEGAVEADLLLVAVGRRPNGDTLNPAAAGVQLDDDGYVVVDDQQRTTAENIWALGDVSSPHQLKHVANAEARVVQHNLLHPDAPTTSDHRFVPHAVFSDPQVASVGLTERDAKAQGVNYVAVTQEYGSVAYGWALADDRHFLKLLADPDTGLLLGAHCIGPQASTIIQPLIQAMSFGLDATSMARGQYWIHPALPELVENALLALPLNQAS